jgi:hypothetical protein
MLHRGLGRFGPTCSNAHLSFELLVSAINSHLQGNSASCVRLAQELLAQWRIGDQRTSVAVTRESGLRGKILPHQHQIGGMRAVADPGISSKSWDRVSAIPPSRNEVYAKQAATAS